MNNKIQITIDNKNIVTTKDKYLLQVALENNIRIPYLCYHKHLSPTSSCRMCLVKVEGMRGLVASCSLKLNDGMKVIAFDEELEKTRKLNLELLLANHDDDCINCESDGICQLQRLAFRYDLGRFNRQIKPIWGRQKPKNDYTSPVLFYKSAKCVQCERCVKSCYELQGKGVLSLASRGLSTHIVAGLANWEMSECDGCGQCIQNCPTGAISMKATYGERIREADIEKKTITTCPYCGVGCQLEISTVGNKILKVDGADQPPNLTRTCVKGRFGLQFVNDSGRLTTPLIRNNGKLEEASWDKALDYVANRLQKIKENYGSNAIAGFASAKCTNEENFVFQKFMRAVISTNNIDHCARLCHSSTVTGLVSSFGSGAMTNSIEEFENADVILVTGSNTTESHPVLATFIKRAIQFNNAQLIVIEPRKIDLAKRADIYLQPKGGTDIAWINGFIHIILNEKLDDKSFIENRTEGFKELKKVVEKYTPEYVESITGIPKNDLIKAAKTYANANCASIAYSMGITQHSHGTDNVKSLANLAMLTGNVGKKSSGVNPLRGQNNVQGSCDMGTLPNNYPGYQKVTDQDVKNKFEKAWQVPLPDQNGLTLLEIMDNIDKGKIKALYIMGENPLVSDPDLNHAKETLQKVEFLVCQDIFHTETTELADVILPSASFAEKNGTFTNTERQVMRVNRVLEPVGESKEDWIIIRELANKLGYQMNYSSLKDIMDEINILTPIYTGITYERVFDQKLNLCWPCPSKEHVGTKILHKETFTKGKGTFFPIEYIPPGELPDNNYQYRLSTGRILQHYHTGTMSRKSQSLNAYVSVPYVEMNKVDLDELSLNPGDKVKITTRRGSIETTVNETDRVDTKNVFIPFHFAESAANILTNDVRDPDSKIPEFKLCACKIEKII